MTATLKPRIATLLLLGSLFALPALAQSPSPLSIPASVEKELSTRASDVTEVTLGKNMLAFAAKFMHDKDEDEDGVRHLIENLDGIYVREYEFDKENQYSPEEVEQLRKSFETPEWTPIIRERSRKSGETTDVLMKTVNGESRGMFILSAEPRELTIVLILGPIHPDELGKLHGLAGLDGLADLDTGSRKGAEDKEKDKIKPKAKPDGAQ
ncbi:MAG TPA: DUF4252 domain-containing protein [Terracidiphilus sp.]|nr:DUF4252 domain-containing protein [Terracidiphilus sp.]